MHLRPILSSCLHIATKCTMPEKPDEGLYASFQPSDAKLLTTTSNTQLLVDCPILASALSSIFPYLLLIDNFLEIITWTNEDAYQNFLIAVLFSIVVLYWHIVSIAILPFLLCLTFSALVWSISSVMHDSKYNEKPTIDEVLYTLHNITVRFELLLRPIQHFYLGPRNFAKAFMMTALLTPFHLFIVRTVLSPTGFTWILGLFMLTYHSPWSYSIRRLLWRSVYVRILAFYITGIDIKLDRKNQNHHRGISRVQSAATSDVEDIQSGAKTSQLLTDFKILKKYIVSATKLKQTVLFEVLENERRWIGIGWSKFTLPNERPSFCYNQSMQAAPVVSDSETSDNFPFPVFENDLYTYLWDWNDEVWSIDYEFNKGKGKEGWVYYDNNWQNESFQDGFSKYTRSRRWVRKATLEIDKQSSVHDL